VAPVGDNRHTSAVTAADGGRVLPSWSELVAILLSEPKPAVSGACRNTADGTVTRFLHDGDRSWLLDDGRRSLVTDGDTTVYVERDRITRYHNRYVYALPDPQALIHPRLLSGLATAEGMVAERTVLEDRPALVAEAMAGRGGATLRIVADEATGMIMSLREASQPGAEVRIEGLEVGAVIDPGTFTWSHGVDEEVWDG